MSCCAENIWINCGTMVNFVCLRKLSVYGNKYYKEQFEISKDYEERLQNKLNRFAKETKTNKSLLLTMITANGIKHNSHSDIVQKEIVLEDLFK